MGIEQAVYKRCMRGPECSHESMIKRRDSVLGAGALAAASTECVPTLSTEKHSPRAIRAPGFQLVTLFLISKRNFRLFGGSTAAFIANSRSELRSHGKNGSPILRQYTDKQDVEFLTVVVVVLPNRSQILIDSLDIHDGTVSVNVRSRVSTEVEDNELAYHRRLLYWTRDWPAVPEPTEIRVVMK